MQVFGKSDIGLKRTSNQDCFDYENINENLLWAVVCDGMGGVNGGDIASNLAVNSIREILTQNYTEGLLPVDVENLLKKAIQKANFEIFSAAQNDNNLSGMGTTIVLVAIFYDKIHIAHIGDSRAYLIRQGNIKQLTVDHSVVQEMINEGEITHEEAKRHPQKNIITRALGISKNVDIDYSIETKKPTDSIIICTDGLTNYFDQNEILDYVKNKKNNQQLIDNFIFTANERGGNDNITVVILGE